MAGERAGSRRRHVLVDPGEDVGHHHLAVEVAEQVVEVAVVELEGLVLGAGLVEEELAAVGAGRLVGGAVQDQERQLEEREVALDPVVGAGEGGDGLGRLHLVLEERVVVHLLDDGGIAGEGLEGQAQHVGVRRDVAQALQHREREVGGVDLEGEALADEAGEAGLVLERVDAGGDAAGAVAEQEDRQAGLALLGDLDEPGEGGDVVVDGVDVVAVAVGAAAAGQIERIDREAGGDELLGGPEIVAASAS